MIREIASGARERATAGFRGEPGRKAAFHAGGTLAGSVLQLVAVSLIARNCPAERWALAMEITAAAAIFEVLTDFGGRFWFGERLAAGAGPREVMRTGFLAKLVFAAICLPLAVPALAGSMPLELAALAAVIGFTQPQADPALWILRASGRTNAEAAVALASRAGAIVAFSACVLLGVPMWLACLAWIAVNALRMAAVAWRDLVGTRAEGGAGLRVRDAVRGSAPAGIAMALQALQNRTGVFLVGIGCGASTTGQFASSYSLVNSVTFVGISIGATMYRPILEGARRVANGEPDSSVREMLGRLRAVMLPISAVGMACTPVAIPVLLGAGNAAATAPAVLLWPALYFSAAQFNLRAVLNCHGRGRWDTLATGAGLAVLLATSLVDCDCAQRPSLIAVAWGAAEITSLAIKYAALPRHVVGAGAMLRDAASLVALYGMAWLVLRVTG